MDSKSCRKTNVSIRLVIISKQKQVYTMNLESHQNKVHPRQGGKNSKFRTEGTFKVPKKTMLKTSRPSNLTATQRKQDLETLMLYAWASGVRLAQGPLPQRSPPQQTLFLRSRKDHCVQTASLLPFSPIPSIPQPASRSACSLQVLFREPPSASRPSFMQESHLRYR